MPLPLHIHSEQSVGQGLSEVAPIDLIIKSTVVSEGESSVSDTGVFTKMHRKHCYSMRTSSYNTEMCLLSSCFWDVCSEPVTGIFIQLTSSTFFMRKSIPVTQPVTASKCWHEYGRQIYLTFLKTHKNMTLCVKGMTPQISPPWIYFRKKERKS